MDARHTAFRRKHTRHQRIGLIEFLLIHQPVAGKHAAHGNNAVLH